MRIFGHRKKIAVYACALFSWLFNVFDPKKIMGNKMLIKMIELIKKLISYSKNILVKKDPLKSPILQKA